jgi:hypothetical protein
MCSGRVRAGEGVGKSVKTGGKSGQTAEPGRAAARCGAARLRPGRFVLLAPALWLACFVPPGQAETAEEEGGIVFSEDAMQEAQRAGTAATSPPAEGQGGAATASQPGGDMPATEGRLFQSPGQSRFQYQSPTATSPNEVAPAMESVPDPAAEAGEAVAGPAPGAEGASEAAVSGLSPAATPEPGGEDSAQAVGQAESGKASIPEPLTEPTAGPHVATAPSVAVASSPLPPAPPAIRQAVSIRDKGRELFLPGNAATGLAAFRSGGDLVLVVDHPLAGPTELPVGAPATAGQANPLAALQVVALAEATVIRVPLPVGDGPQRASGAAQGQALPPIGFVHDSAGWRVCLGGVCPSEPQGAAGALPAPASRPAVSASGPGVVRLPGFVLFTGVGRGPVLSLPDPATGGTVFVALSTRLTSPVRQEAVAVGYRVRPSWQGLAIMADSSRVTLRPTEYGPVVDSVAPVPLPVGLTQEGTAAGAASGLVHGGGAHGRDWEWLGLRDEPVALLVQRWQAARAALKASGRTEGGTRDDAGEKASGHTSRHSGRPHNGQHTGKHISKHAGKHAGRHTGGSHGAQGGEVGRGSAVVPWPVRVAAARAAFAVGDAGQSWLLLRDLPSSSALGGVPDGVAEQGRRAGEPPALHAGGTARDSAMVLRACAALLAGAPAEATLLADADIRFGPDMALWQALYEMMTGADSRQTAVLLARQYARLSQYPAPVRDRLAPRVAAYVARYGAPETLAVLRAALREAPPDDTAHALARALLDARQGQTDAALMALETLRAGGGPNADRAGVDLIGLRLSLGQISPAEAASAYEPLLAARNVHAGAAGQNVSVLPASAQPSGLPALPRVAARLGYASALAQAGRPQAAASVLSGLEAGEATPQDRLAEVWRQVLYGLVFGVVPQDFPTGSAPPARVGFAPGDTALALAGAYMDRLPYDAATAKLLAGYGAALVRAGRAAQAVPVLAQAEFLSTTPATRADRAELLARAALEAGQAPVAAQALQRAAPAGFSFGMPADFPADMPDRLRYDNALAALAGGQAEQALHVLATDESDDGLLLRGRIYEQQRQWAQAVLVLGRLASRALPAKGALTPDQVALARRLAQDAVAAGDADTLTRLRAWVGARAILPAGL